MSDFESFLQSLKKAIAGVVGSEWKDHAKAVSSVYESFVEKSKSDLKRWLELRAQGLITQNELKSLLNGKKDLFELELERRKEALKIGLNKLWTRLIDVLTGEIEKAIRGGKG